jgi:hypothetical protein
MFLVFTAHFHVRGSPVSGKSVETRQHGEVDEELKFDYHKYCTVVPIFFSLFHFLLCYLSISVYRHFHS